MTKEDQEQIEEKTLQVLIQIEKRLARLEQILDCCLVNAPGAGNGALRTVETRQA